MFTRKWWFSLAPDNSGGSGGSSDEGDKDDGGSSDDEGDKGGKSSDSLDFLKTPKDDPIDDGEGVGLASSKKSKDKPADTGDRPSNIPEKFWNVEKKELRVDTLLDSYAEAESNLTRIRGEHQVPEFVEEYLEVFTFDDEGELRYSEGILNLPPMKKDDPFFKGFLDSCHKHGLSTEQTAGLVKESFQAMDGLYPKQFDDEAYRSEQQAILGANHEMQIEVAQNWIKSLHTQGVLNVNEARALHKDVGHSAAGIMALNKLRAEMTGEAMIPVHDSIPEDGIPTSEELYAMKLDPKYKTDVEYRKKVDNLFPVVFPGTGNANLSGVGMRAIMANDARARQKKN